jgi:hypothetical protein
MAPIWRNYAQTNALAAAAQRAQVGNEENNVDLRRLRPEEADRQAAIAGLVHDKAPATEDLRDGNP